MDTGIRQYDGILKHLMWLCSNLPNSSSRTCTGQSIYHPKNIQPYGWQL